MKHEIIIRDLNDLDRAAGQFLNETKGQNILAFFAPMGAGKTTFTTALCRRLGVREDAISSPTFAIVNEYRSGAGEPIYHFDFYRITRLEEALDIGIEALLPEETLRIHIRVNPDESRTVSWED